MRRIVRAVRGLADAIGVDGAFITTGTVFIAIGSSYFSAAAPYIVVGAVCMAIGIYAIWAQRQTPRSS